jgi:hypothetical protein
MLKKKNICKEFTCTDYIILDVFFQAFDSKVTSKRIWVHKARQNIPSETQDI